MSWGFPLVCISKFIRYSLPVIRRIGLRVGYAKLRDDFYVNLISAAEKTVDFILSFLKFEN